MKQSNNAKKLAGVCLTIACLMTAAPVYAESEEPKEEVAGELDEAAQSVADAAQHLIRALEIVIDNLPQYAPPEILENGDILIRRLPSKSETEEGDGEAEE